MDTSRVKSGFIIGPSRFFYGSILYDSDQEVAFYNFRD